MSVPEPTIQIVDDDESFLAAISRLLRASGFAVKTFSSAIDLLAACDTVVFKGQAMNLGFQCVKNVKRPDDGPGTQVRFNFALLFPTKPSA